MPIHDIQSSFNGGEAAPDIQGRVDLAKYKTFVKTGRNFIGSPHGPAYNRPGTFLVGKSNSTTTKVRVVRFISSTSAAYVLEFGVNYIWVYKNGARLGSVAVTTTYAEADLPNLKFTQSVDKLYIAHQSYAPQVLTRTDDATWSLAAYAYEDGPFMLPNLVASQQMQVNFDGAKYNLITVGGYDYFKSGMVGGLFLLRYYIQSNTVIKAFTATGQNTQMYCGGPWRLVTGGTWTGTFSVEKSVDGGSTWTVLQTFHSNIVGSAGLNANTFADESPGSPSDPYGDSFLIRLNFTDITYGSCETTFTRDAYTHIGVVRITAVTDARNAICSIIRTPITPQNENIDWFATIVNTSDWAEGSWSTLRGWPGTVAFSQDRLCWAGTPSEPQTCWMTKTGNYINFGRSIPLVDSDGITINLQSRRLNPIQNLVPFLGTLLAFTSDSEWSITSDSGFLTPATVYSKLQGVRGSTEVDPVLIGDRIVFIEVSGTIVRDMEYQYFTQIFKSENISTLASHLFQGHSIVSMAYQLSPDSILWAVRDDGILLSLTYLREQEVLCWFWHDTQGTFESVCTIPGSGVDEVWFSVLRNGARYIERMLLRTTSTDPADQYFVDCGFTYSGSPVASISGHPEFNGLTVAVNAEGFVLDQQIVSGGIINFDRARSKAQVGLPYTPDLELLNPEFQVQGGTLQGRRYQISAVVMRFLNSRGGNIGPDSTRLVEPIDVRDRSLSVNTPTPLFTGFDPHVMPQGDGQASHVMYRQNEPMPVTIVSVLPIIDPGEDIMLSGIDS